jgi:hypothetical protein
MTYRTASQQKRSRWRTVRFIVGAVLATIVSVLFWIGLVYYGATEHPDHPDWGDRTYRGP